MLAVRVFSVAALILALGFGARSLAQTDIAPELRDRPPVAAPTSKIEVGAINVVLSESQEADNFAAGMMRGLMVGTRVKGIALVAVKDDHIIVQRVVDSLMPETRVALGSLSQVFDTIGAMQQVERGKLMLDADIATALGESGKRDMTLAQVLSFQRGDPSLVRQVVQKASGVSADDYVTKEILGPISMGLSRIQNGDVETTLMDMSHLAIALVHDGAFENGRILQAASVEAMEANHYAPHPAVGGAAYGFTEMRRSGWRALQHDGVAPNFESRLVVVPEAKSAYFIVLEGKAEPEFWQTLDNGFFDKLFPPRMPAQVASAVPGPGPADANRVAGLYEPLRDVMGSVAPLKHMGALRVKALSEGTLVLTGDEQVTLAPKPGGYWESGDGTVAAVAADGRLLLSNGAYGFRPIYKRPELYSVLALLAAIATGGLIWWQRRTKIVWPLPKNPVLGAAAASVVFILVSIVVWLFSPAV